MTQSMTQWTALIVSEPTTTADDLRDTLAQDGLSVAVVDPAGALGFASGVTPDVVLFSAAMSAEAVAAVADTLGARDGQPPLFLAYADSGMENLERHVGGGMDYVIPPFSAALVHSRLAALRQREELAQTLRQVQDAAHLAEYERELQIGREIQSGFLPEVLPQPAGWDIGFRFRPAKVVAGDFYDGFTLVNGRRIGFVVADVCDKGVGAALFMALIRSLLRHTASHAGSLSLVGLDAQWEVDHNPNDPAHRTGATSAGVGPLLNAVAGTHEYMTQNHLTQGYFATLFFGVLDPVTGALVYINCGHNPPVLRRADGAEITLPPTGPALGMLPGSTFKLGRARFNPGDTLFLYTDGVTEAKNARGEFFTEARMRKVLSTAPDLASGAVLQRFEDELHGFVGAADQFDDITMMAVHRHPGIMPGARGPGTEES